MKLTKSERRKKINKIIKLANKYESTASPEFLKEAGYTKKQSCNEFLEAHGTLHIKKTYSYIFK